MKTGELFLAHVDELSSILGLLHFEGADGEGYAKDVTRMFRPRRLLGGLRNERIIHTYKDGNFESRRKIKIQAE